MRKVAEKPTTPEQRLAALWARINAKPAYQMPEVCRHGFARGELDGQGCPQGD
jgi:hypothetical protein